MVKREPMARPCYCYTCEKSFHHLGINRHVAMHRDRKEDCKVRYKRSGTFVHYFSELREKP